MAEAGTAESAPSGSERSAGKHSLTCRVFRHGAAADRPSQLRDISDVLDEEGSLVWFDVVDPQDTDLATLQEEFQLHPLAIEDAIHAHQRPKIDQYGFYWFVVVQATTLTPSGIEFHEIAIFASRKFVVTVRHSPAYPLEEIERRWHSHPERLRHGGGFLLYTILDTVVDGYFPVADWFQERVDEIEDNLFANQPLRDDLLPEIFGMKKDAQRFRHSIVPMRDILNPIIREDVRFFPDEDTAYFRDVYDHAVRLIDQVDSLRDLVTSALEINLSVVANRNNEVSRQLTIIATIFLPLSFIVGFFGQNFAWLVDHLEGQPAFLLLGIGSEIVAITLTVGYFKLRRWF